MSSILIVSTSNFPDLPLAQVVSAAADTLSDRQRCVRGIMIRPAFALAGRQIGFRVQ